jgi:hypothetical protein
LAADDLRGSFNWTHGRSLAGLDFRCQAPLNLFLRPRFRLSP